MDAPLGRTLNHSYAYQHETLYVSTLHPHRARHAAVQTSALCRLVSHGFRSSMLILVDEA